MTEQAYFESIRKIIENKRILESSFKVKLLVREHIVRIEGKSEDELFAMQALEALDLGFSIKKVLLLLEENMVFEKILIKAISNRKSLEQVRARVIGTNRKALDTIEDLTGCFLSLHNNTVGIIGDESDVKNASFAIKRIIAGSKHSVMYGWLEKKKAEDFY